MAKRKGSGLFDKPLKLTGLTYTYVRTMYGVPFDHWEPEWKAVMHEYGAFDEYEIASMRWNGWTARDALRELEAKRALRQANNLLAEYWAFDTMRLDGTGDA